MAKNKSISLQKPGSYLPFFLILTLGAFLRFFRVGEQFIIDDEWHALNAVQDHDYGWIYSHIGHADHSIPLTLLYELFSHTIGLGEITMRLPSLIAGVIAIVLLPRLMRPWLKPGETLMMSALIAISPFLINYSRIARPYSMLFLLAGASLILAWLWWKNDDRTSGAGWIFCTVLAAWLNPVSLALTTSPFLWFLASALVESKSGNHLPLRRAIYTGAGISLCVGLLLYSPISNDFASLAVKSGLHQANAETLLVAATLYSGSGYLLVTALMTGVAITGWLFLYRRDRGFALYIIAVSTASTLAVLLTGAEWISFGLVLARYQIGLLAIFLALVSIGLATIGGKLLAALNLPRNHLNWLAPVCLLVLFLSGPLPLARAGTNQFMHHMSLQFDYDPDRNPITVALEPLTPEPFYQEIAAHHPGGDAVIVETPWYLESNWNGLPIYQQVHGQQVLVASVGGVCAGRLYGELRQDIEGLNFRHFVSLQSVLEGKTGADYLVFRTGSPPGAREIPMDREKCEQAIRESFGVPWRTTEHALVFRLSGAS